MEKNIDYPLLGKLLLNAHYQVRKISKKDCLSESKNENLNRIIP